MRRKSEKDIIVPADRDSGPELMLYDAQKGAVYFLNKMNKVIWEGIVAMKREVAGKDMERLG